MDITTLLHKLAVVPNVEIVITLLPEMLGVADQTSRYTLFQRLKGIGERAALGLTDQQVNMLRHNHVSVNAKAAIAGHTLERGFDDLLGKVSRE